MRYLGFLKTMFLAFIIGVFSIFTVGFIFSIYPGLDVVGNFLLEKVEIIKNLPAWLQAFSALCLIVWGIFTFERDVFERELLKNNELSQKVLDAKIFVLRNESLFARFNQLIFRLQYLTGRVDKGYALRDVHYRSAFVFCSALEVIDGFIREVNEFVVMRSNSPIPDFCVDVIYEMEIQSGKLKNIITMIEFAGYELNKIRVIGDLLNVRDESFKGVEMIGFDKDCKVLIPYLENSLRELSSINNKLVKKIY